jgi:hypothetical protein
MSDLSLLWTILSIIGSVIGSVAVAAWWLKSQLTSAELAGLREQNAALTAWRGFAEAQAKQLAEQLSEARATQGSLQKQIAEGAQKEVLAVTAASSSRAIGAAEDVLKAWTFDAYAAVGKVLGAAKASVLMVDPYADVKILGFAVLAPDNVPVQVLADGAKYKPTLKLAAERFGQQFRASRAPLEVRLSPPKTLHDRLIIVDNANVWLLGQSFNALAEGSPTSLIRENDETAQMKIAVYGAMWQSATPLWPVP